MGLFDIGGEGGGGALDISSLLQLIAGGGGGAPQPPLTPDALLRSQSATNPIVPPPEPAGSYMNPRPVPTLPQPSIVAPSGPGIADVPGVNRSYGGTWPPGQEPPMGNGAGEPATVPRTPSMPVAQPVELAAAPTLGRGTGAAGVEPDAAPGRLGEELTGSKTDAEVGARKKNPDDTATLAAALRGVGGIRPPEVQRINSPNPPRPTGTIKSGELMALLMALNAGAGATDRKLPATLGRG